jgi:hypothetical protein
LKSNLIPPWAALADWDYYERPLEVVLRRQRVGKFQKYDAAWAKQRIRTGLLHVVDLFHEGERCGFMLLMIDRSGLVPSCLLWFGYMERGAPPSETAWPELRRWAKRFRCPLVEFVSSRPGLFKKAPKHGWEEIYRGFAAEV